MGRVSAWSGVLAAALYLGCGEGAGHTGPAADDSGLAAITAPSLQEWIGRLADDSMRGRGTPSPELDGAAAAIAAEFTALGLAGAFGPATYTQVFPIRGHADTTAPNVAGILRGSDPVLRDEYLVLVAHMDHLGIGLPVAGDSIYNGADDNASGTAGVVALARAFTTGPAPRRSLLFLLVSGEEHGLWGSAWFVDHAPVGIGQIVAALDLDMIGRNARDSIFAIGLAQSTLGDAVLQAVAAHPEDQMRASPNAGGMSDQVPFISRGVPALAFFNGLHGDYHRPTDTADRIDAEKMTRVLRLVYRTARSVADAGSRPAWKPGYPVAVR